MNAKKIAFPTDFSRFSDAGLEYATTLAGDTGAELLIVHVEEPPNVYAEGEMYYGILEPDNADLWRMLYEVKPADPEVRYEHRMLHGDPAREIIRLAGEEKADMIVMGTHGRTGFRRLLMGSVAEAVVRGAPCPVITIKHAVKAPEPVAHTG